MDAPGPSTERDRRIPWALFLAFSALEVWLRLPVLRGTVALYARDLYLLYYPLVQAILRVVSEGALPLRDPTSAFGQAILSDPSNQLLYPPVWLHLFLPPPLAYGWMVSIHSVIGALGVGLLCRRLSGGSVSGALVAGVAWQLSGPLQSLATLWHHMSGAAWIPWVLLGVERVLESRDRRRVVELGVLLSAQILAGSADMCAMTILLAAFRILLEGGWRHWQAWIGSGALAVVLSAGAWLPALASLGGSGRTALAESTRTFWSVHPLSFLEFFLPLPLTMLPLSDPWKAAVFESREPFLGSMFLGAWLLPFLLAALFDPTRTRVLRLGYGGGALIGLWVALGKNSIGYALLVTLIPPLRILRYPSKVMIPVAVLACVLAGLGAASLPRSARSRKAAAAGVVTIAAMALLFLGPVRVPFESTFFDPGDAFGVAQFHRNVSPDLFATLGILALLAAFVRWPQRRALLGLAFLGSAGQSVDLLSYLNPTVPAEVLAYKPEHIEDIRPSSDGRVLVYDYSLLQGAAQKNLGTPTLVWTGLDRFGPDAGPIVASHAYLQPVTGGLWGIEYAWDTDLRLLSDQRLVELTNALRLAEGGPGFLKLLQTSGVEKVVALHERGMQGLNLLSRHRIFHREPLRIFGVPNPLPRAHLTSGKTRIRGSDAAALLDPGFDPRTTILVDSGPERVPEESFEGKAHVLERRADRLTIETTSNQSGFLTVMEGVLPGWRVWIDGHPAPLHRANAVFFGTEVPAGTHRVEFRFLPVWAVAGVLLSFIAGVALFVWALSNLVAREPESGRT